MRIPGLTLVVLAVTTSLASAVPAREETTGRVSYNDRAPKPITAVDPGDGWVELASATPARHGREFIVVGADAGAITHLRLTAASGHPGIQAVRVEYVDGTRRTFPVDKTLTAKRRPALIDLHGPREIAQLVVISDRDSPGSYIVAGRTGATGVALR